MRPVASFFTRSTLATAAEAVRAHAVPGDDRGRPDDGRHREGPGAGRHDDRGGDLSRSVGADHPGRKDRRWPHPDAGHHQRRADHQRSPGVAAPGDESLYGLGQHQHGLLDIKDTDFDLRQYNTEVFIPYLVSSRGYGILWDNTSYSRFGDLVDPVPLPGVSGLYASGGAPGDVSPGSGSVSWSGTVTPTATGDTTFRTFSAGQVQLRSTARRSSITGVRGGCRPRISRSRRYRRPGGAGQADLAGRQRQHHPTAVEATGGQPDHLALVAGRRRGRLLLRLRAGAGRRGGRLPPPHRAARRCCRSGPSGTGSRASTTRRPGDHRRPVRLSQRATRRSTTSCRTGSTGAPNWGSHQFDPSRYPDPAGLIRTSTTRITRGS